MAKEKNETRIRLLRMLELLQNESDEQHPISTPCSGPGKIATAGPVENANFGSTEKATTRILSYPLY